jgi:hypothetical protein
MTDIIDEKVAVDTAEASSENVDSDGVGETKVLGHLSTLEEGGFDERATTLLLRKIDRTLLPFLALLYLLVAPHTLRLESIVFLTVDSGLV